MKLRHYFPIRGLLDVDGVLGDFHTPCLKIINELGGTNHKVEDFDSWDIFDALKVPPDIKAKVYDEMHKPGWCTNLAVYPGAVEGVTRLQELCDVYVVTSPMDSLTWEGERKAWLRKHFGISKYRVVQTPSKHVVAGDFLVDDKIDNLVQWRAGHPDGLPIRWVMPHLAGHDWNGVAVKQWDELHAVVAGMRKGDRQWQHQIT